MQRPIDLVIIGAGPYGLSLAAHLAARGIDFRIFGRALDTWAHHMPRKMTLKSEGFASNLSAPDGAFTLKDWCKRQGVAYEDQGLPIALDTFLSYASAFRASFVPNLEESQVVALEPSEAGYSLCLDSGERIQTRNVVLAVGVSWFAYTPPLLARLPASLVTHSYQYRDTDSFSDRDVAVIGTGSSAIDLAHALKESGARPCIIGRAKTIEYNIVPDPERARMLYRLQNPPSTIGRGWRSFFCAEAPLLFYRLPRHLKDRAIASHMHPAAGWFMREQVEGVVPTRLGVKLTGASVENGKVTLDLANGTNTETHGFDHAIAATGYRVDLSRLPFVSASLRNTIALSSTSPLVSDNFETTVPGLYAIGLAAMEMFGPLLRFMVGAEFVAPRLASHLARKIQVSSRRRAA